MDLDTMPLDAQEKLKKVLKLSLDELNVGDIAFIQSRRDYLTDSQKNKFESILTEKNIKRFQKEALDEEKQRDKRVEAEAILKEAIVINEDDEEPKKEKKDKKAKEE